MRAVFVDTSAWDALEDRSEIRATATTLQPSAIERS